MAFLDVKTADRLRELWSDKLVKIKPGSRPELDRFKNRVGRVVTVTHSGRALVDFADGGWYDIAEFDAVLEEVTDEIEKKKYDPTANSAQKVPTRQG